MSILSTVYDVQRYAQACVRYANETSKYKFSVEFHDPREHHGRPQYYTYCKNDRVVIHVPNPSSSMSERDAKVIKAGILHECLHTAEGTHDGLDEIYDSGIGKLGPNDPLAHIFNVVEDHRIERLDCEKFEGDAYVLRDAYEILSEDFTEHLKTMDTSALEDQTLKIMGLKLTDYAARDPWMNLGMVAEDQFKINPEISQDTARKLIDKGYDDKIRKVDTVSEAIDLSKQIFRELFDIDPEQHIEDNKQEGEGKEGEGEQAEGEGAGQEGEGEDGEGKVEGVEAQEGDGEGGKLQDIPAHDVDYLTFIEKGKQPPSSGDSPPSTGQHISYERYLKSAKDFRQFEPCPMDEIGVANFGADVYKPFGGSGNTKSLVSRPVRGMNGREELDEVFSKHGLQVNALANKIRRLLQVQSQARWVGGATSGRIHRKSAYRAALPMVGDGHWNREIFKRRHQDNTLDIAVSILCDFSGSMGGEKMAHAAFGGFILSDAIGRVLRVPVQVQTFSEVSESTIICVLKNWQEFVTEDTYKERASRAVRTMEQNDDGSAIIWTYEDLIRRPEKRKVMIVLSDGSPASSRSGDAMKYTRNVVSDIEKEGRVEMYGIGIMDRNVSHIYSQYETINGPDEIEPAILNTVKRKLIV